MRPVSLCSLLVLGGCIYGCTFINAPGDVVQEPAGGTNTGATGATDSVGGQDTSMGGAPDTGGTNGMSGEGPSVGGGDIGVGGAEDPGPGPDPTTGLVVLGAADADMTRHLLVLNFRTGAEIRRDEVPVAAVAYDEAPERHVWFVFTASDFPAPTTDVVDLEVRRFNDATKSWVVLSKTTQLPPPQPDQLVVLNDRLVYLSHQVVNGNPVSSITLLDTSDLSDVSELATRTAATGQEYVGVVGDRGSAVDAEAPGGRLRLMISQDCTATDCELVAQQVFASAVFTDGTTFGIDRYVGQPRFAKARQLDRLYAALRSTNANRLVVRSYQGANLTNPLVATLSDFAGDDVGGFDLAECADAGVVSDVMGQQLIAFHLTSGLAQAQDLASAGGMLYSEPFAPSVIMLDPASAPGLRSFEVSRSGTTNVVVNERSTWVPNNDLMPLTGAVRRSEAGDCP